MTEYVSAVHIGHNAFATMPEHFEWIVKQNLQKEAMQSGVVLTSISVGHHIELYETEDGRIHEIVKVWAKGISDD